MSRDIPFDEDAECDTCHKKGAFDFMGDYICPECLAKGETDVITDVIIEATEAAEATITEGIAGNQQNSTNINKIQQNVL